MSEEGKITASRMDSILPVKTINTKYFNFFVLEKRQKNATIGLSESPDHTQLMVFCNSFITALEGVIDGSGFCNQAKVGICFKGNCFLKEKEARMLFDFLKSHKTVTKYTVSQNGKELWLDSSYVQAGRERLKRLVFVFPNCPKSRFYIPPLSESGGGAIDADGMVQFVKQDRTLEKKDVAAPAKTDAAAPAKKKNNRRVSAPFDEKLADLKNEMAEVLGVKRAAGDEQKPQAAKKAKKRGKSPQFGYSIVRMNPPIHDAPPPKKKARLAVKCQPQKNPIFSPLVTPSSPTKPAPKEESTKSTDTAFTFETVETEATDSKPNESPGLVAAKTDGNEDGSLEDGQCESQFTEMLHEQIKTGQAFGSQK